MSAATSTERAAALTALLGRLDSCMGRSGYGTDHPWRMLIADGLAGEPPGQVVQPPTDSVPVQDGRLEAVGEIAAQIGYSLMNVIHLLDNNIGDEQSMLLAADALARVGWLAERAAVLACGPTAAIKGSADGWFLGPATQAQVKQLAVRGLA